MKKLILIITMMFSPSVFAYELEDLHKCKYRQIMKVTYHIAADGITGKTILQAYSGSGGGMFVINNIISTDIASVIVCESKRNRDKDIFGGEPVLCTDYGCYSIQH